MVKYRGNAGTEWTRQQEKYLRELAKENTPTRVMGIKLERTPEAVAKHASEMGISLKPTNQRPYGTKKK